MNWSLMGWRQPWQSTDDIIIKVLVVLFLFSIESKIFGKQMRVEIIFCC